MRRGLAGGRGGGRRRRRCPRRRRRRASRIRSRRPRASTSRSSAGGGRTRWSTTPRSRPSWTRWPTRASAAPRSPTSTTAPTQALDPGRPRLGHAGVASARAGRAREGQGARDDDRPHRRPGVAVGGPEHHARQRRARSRSSPTGIANVAPGATFSGAAARARARAAPRPRSRSRSCVYVQAAKVTVAGDPPTTAYTLDGSTVTDVPIAADGTVSWTAPADGNWVLISYWERGSGQKPEGSAHTTPDSYVIDHFSQTGTKAITDFWDAHILTPGDPLAAQGRGRRAVRGLARARDRLRAVDAGLRRRLPAAARLQPAAVPAAGRQERREGRSSTTRLRRPRRRVRRDVNLVLTNLYNENHLKPLKAWANALGLKLRVQPYGLQTDAMQASALLDIPEGESLGFKNLDDYRRQAGARDLAGNTILSNEAGATAGGAYSTTWETELRKLAPEFAARRQPERLPRLLLRDHAGVAAGPASPPSRRCTTSPATASRGARASRPGSTRPTSAATSPATRQVMQTGRNIVDAAVLVQTGYVAAGYGAPYFTADTREAVAGAQGRRHARRLDQRDDQRVDARPAQRDGRATSASRRTARTSRRSCSRATSPSAARTCCASRPPRSCSTGPRPGCRS